MKIVSGQILTQELGDSQINAFQLTGEDNLILTIQERGSSVLAVVGRQPDGELIFGTENDTVSGKCSIISDVSITDLEKFNEKLIKLIQEHRESKNKENKS
jgi:hypothetical protein